MGGADCMTRQTPGLHLEQALWQQGIQIIGGIDEAGRGAWAGPVTAAAVVLANDPQIGLTLSGVRDSKQLTPRKRDQLAPRIREIALTCGIGFAATKPIFLLLDM